MGRLEKILHGVQLKSGTWTEKDTVVAEEADTSSAATTQHHKMETFLFERVRPASVLQVMSASTEAKIREDPKSGPMTRCPPLAKAGSPALPTGLQQRRLRAQASWKAQVSDHPMNHEDKLGPNLESLQTHYKPRTEQGPYFRSL